MLQQTLTQLPCFRGQTLRNGVALFQLNDGKCVEVYMLSVYLFQNKNMQILVNFIFVLNFEFDNKLIPVLYHCLKLLDLRV